MGFSVRLAPGVRVRVSSRGVRTSLGPRAARVHVGAGRPGFSTGAGPVGYYTSLGGGRPRRTTGSAAAARELATARRAMTAQAKAEEAQRLSAALEAVLDLHRAEFPPARPPTAPPPPPIDVADIRRRHIAEAKAATSIFARAERKAALAEAERRTAAEVSHLQQTYAAQQAAWQASLDQQWRALNANEPEAVLTTLAAAFEDNEAAASAVGVGGAEVSLVVVVPRPDALPERHPTLTPAGNLSLKKFTKRELADLYKLLVCGHVLVTVKEAFAVAPGLQAARVVAVRPSAVDAYGRIHAEPLVAARFERSALIGIQWAQADAVRVVNDATTERILIQKGATQQLMPIDLDEEPGLRPLVEAVDMETLQDA